jgi:hypothetical protein
MIWRQILVLVISTISHLAFAENFTGTWGSRAAPEVDFSELKVIHRGNSIQFQLEMSIGPPSYNSGFIAGSFDLKKNVGIFVEGKPSDCSLIFTFTKSKVKTKQVGDCGFGNGVYLGGDLPRISRAIPLFSKGDPRVGD